MKLEVGVPSVDVPPTKMKYNTISTSSLASEGKKSTLTIYADMDISHNKVNISVWAFFYSMP